MKSIAQNRYVYLYILITVVLSSCVKDMDFDGAKDVTLIPGITLDLMHAEVTTELVVEEMEKVAQQGGLTEPYPSIIYTAGVPSFTVDKAVDLASDERITKYLDSVATIYFDMKNTTPREISIHIELKDGANNPIDGGTLDKTLTSATDTPVIDSLVFTDKGINNLKNLKKVEVEITIKAGVNLKNDQSGEFTLSSSGNFNFKYEVSNGLP